MGLRMIGCRYDGFGGCGRRASRVVGRLCARDGGWGTVGEAVRFEGLGHLYLYVMSGEIW